MAENFLIALGAFAFSMVLIFPGALPMWANIVIVVLLVATFASKVYELRQLRA